MAKAEEKHREELRQAKEEMVEALRVKDLELAEELKKSSEQLARKLRQMDRDKVRLESDLQMQLRQRLCSKCQQTSTQNRSVFFGALTGGFVCWLDWLEAAVTSIGRLAAVFGGPQIAASIETLA
jgi:chemotaxis response regulator CheB